MKELQVCSFGELGGTESERPVCWRSVECCFFVAGVAAAAVGFVAVASTADLDRALGAVVAGRCLLPSAGVS